MKITPCKKAQKPYLPPIEQPLIYSEELPQHLSGACIITQEYDIQMGLQTWLKALHKDSAWLAEQCQVTTKTVDRWLSQKTRLTPSRAKRILKIMEEFPAPGYLPALIPPQPVSAPASPQVPGDGSAGLQRG